MIRAIIFDCFGVLATEGLLAFREKYFGDKPALMREAHAVGRRVDAGLGDYRELFERLAQLAGITTEEARREIQNHAPNKPLLAYIRQELKPTYKIGMLSNVGTNWLNDIFTPGQLALLDATALSYETGFLKPDARAYTTAAERLDVSPEACVFVDDQERYCTGAREAGMQAVWYRHFAQCKRELEAILTA